MQELKKKLLYDAIFEAEDYEWDNNLLQRVLAKNDMSVEAFSILFQSKLMSLAEYFLSEIDFSIKNIDLKSKPIHIAISQIIVQRFQFMEEYRSASLKILNYINVPLHSAIVADKIWDLTNASTGFDYYTRRLTLTYVYYRCLGAYKNSYDEAVLMLDHQLQNIGQITRWKKKIHIFLNKKQL